jgi:TPR repeat protein
MKHTPSCKAAIACTLLTTFFITPLYALDSKSWLEGKPWPNLATDNPVSQNDQAFNRAFEAYSQGFYVSAFRQAEHLAESGHAKAMNLLAELYLQGRGTIKDESKAIVWLKKAAEKNISEAQFTLGTLYLSGSESIQKDKVKAAEYFELAAKEGHPEAAYNIAMLYIKGQTIPRDLKKAASYLEIAAKQDNAEAQYALGLFYTEGAAVLPDDIAAATWIGKAALNGLTEAQVEYAILLLQGKGVEKNEEAAFQWLETAALKDNPVAQSRLARLYATGTGVPLDMVRAAAWHIRAQSHGLNNEWLSGLLAEMSIEQRIEAENLAAGSLAELKRDTSKPPALASKELPEQNAEPQAQ